MKFGNKVEVDVPVGVRSITTKFAITPTEIITGYEMDTSIRSLQPILKTYKSWEWLGVYYELQETVAVYDDSDLTKVTHEWKTISRVSRSVAVDSLISVGLFHPDINPGGYAMVPEFFKQLKELDKFYDEHDALLETMSRNQVKTKNFSVLVNPDDQFTKGKT